MLKRAVRYQATDLKHLPGSVWAWRVFKIQAKWTSHELFAARL